MTSALCVITTYNDTAHIINTLTGEHLRIINYVTGEISVWGDLLFELGDYWYKLLPIGPPPVSMTSSNPGSDGEIGTSTAARRALGIVVGA